MGDPADRFEQGRMNKRHSPPQHGPAEDVREGASTPLPQASILLVDDDPRNLLALQELLGHLGHHLVPAKSGAEALRQSLQRDFALILLDVLMPDMDGFEVAKLIRERERSRHTPIIFLTGAYEDSPSMFRGYEAGAVDYIIKPLNPEVLKSKIAVFIELYRKSAVLTREIAERKQAEEQLRQSEERLRALTARLQSVREEERTTISREIHDELGQSLTGLKMDLTWLANHVKGEQKHLAPKFKSMFGLIDETIHSVRRIASGLRPEVLDEAEGLTAAIGWQAKHFQMRTGIRCKIDLPAESPALDQERSTATFRIFQEILTNVARHAEATRLDVSMKVDTERLRLQVRDNGKGISESAVRGQKSLGLLGMNERAALIGGKIDIWGAAGKGTKVTLTIPLNSK
jgi:signal transduction histidine kinase